MSLLHYKDFKDRYGVEKAIHRLYMQFDLQTQNNFDMELIKDYITKLEKTLEEIEDKK